MMPDCEIVEVEAMQGELWQMCRGILERGDMREQRGIVMNLYLRRGKGSRFLAFQLVEAQPWSGSVVTALGSHETSTTPARCLSKIILFSTGFVSIFSPRNSKEVPEKSQVPAFKGT